LKGGTKTTRPGATARLSDCFSLSGEHEKPTKKIKSALTGLFIKVPKVRQKNGHRIQPAIFLLNLLFCQKSLALWRNMIN
jgi:hypothetical protein